MTRGVGGVWRTTARFLGCGAVWLASGVVAAAQEAPPESPGVPTYPSLRLIGFTDAGFSVTDADNPVSNSGFFQGQFVLHLTSALSPRLAFFGEVSLTASDDAAYVHRTGSSSGTSYHTAADVHRAMLKYTHRDGLKLSIGRFHTPVSYWNVTYHHGPWLQTTVTRPRILDFASPFLPLHFTAAFAEGGLPSGGMNLGYAVGLGNGRGGGPGRPEAPADANNNRAWVARLAARPEWVRGLDVGGAYYADKVSVRYGETTSDFREQIVNGYLVLTTETPEILAEYLSIRHRPVGGPAAYTSRAYYVQGAWRLGLFGQKVKPYVRWEEIHLNASDPLLNAAVGGRGLLTGVRVDVSDFVSLKAEYQHQDEAAPFHNGFFTQASLTF